MRDPLCRFGLEYICLVCLAVPLGATALRGVVKDESGAPLPNAKVFIYQEGETRIATTSTNKTGEYAFEVVPNGVYYAEARMEGFLSVRYHPIYLQHPRAKVVDFKLPIDIEDLWAMYAPPPSFYTHATVTGELVQDGEHTANARICASGKPGTFCTTTNKLGQYSFEVPPGRYSFEVHVAGATRRFPSIKLDETAREYVDLIGDRAKNADTP